jgi:dephospho-CoA kinase
MKVIGIVGGVASGKSTVGREFARLGAVVLDADESAHRALDDPDVKAALVARWGEGILSADGRVDRTTVAAKVFGHAAADEERRFLESLVHPRVRRDLEAQMQALAARGVGAVVLDIPLLVEVGWQDMCDVVYFLDVPRSERIRRAKERGWSEDELNRREAAQASVEEKRQAADRVIANGGSVDDLRREVDAAWSELQGRGGG